MKSAFGLGSFDPVTLGHLDIIQRATKLFDKVIILVMSNSLKHCAFTIDERIALLKKCVSNSAIEIDTYD